MRKEYKAWFGVLQEMIRKCPGVAFSGFAEGVLQGIMPFVAIYFTGLLVDAVYQGVPVDELILYALLGSGITMAVSLLNGIAVKVFNQNMEYMYERQTGPLAAKSMQMDYEYLEDARVHSLREQISGFIPRFGLIGMVLDCVYHTMDVVFSLVCAFVIIVPKLIAGKESSHAFIGSVWCDILFFGGIVFLTILNIHTYSKLNDRDKVLFDERSRLRTKKGYYLDLYSKADSQKDILMCSQGSLVQREIQAIYDHSLTIMKRQIKLTYEKCLKTDALSSFSTLLVFVFSAIYGYCGVISIGSVVAFAASIKRVSERLFVLSEAIGDFKYQAIYAAKYEEFMQLNQRKHAGTIPMEKRTDNKFTVEFENVSFKYPGATDYVIKNLNLKFVVGEKLAIVGKNGSGKTTFIKLLCRLYDVTEGCIKVNGIDIRKYDYQEYARLFGVVFQDFSIFDFKLGENLASSEQVDSEKARDALVRAGLQERFEELENGLDTYIGKGFDESGVNFSGGEKQKTAIARAIYKDAPFVIMDEPTAALDPEAEAEVFEGFDKMVGKKTAIYISHRLASCKFCEDILVFDKGKVVQHGSHEKLEKQDGLYRKLWEAQAGYYA